MTEFKLCIILLFAIHNMYVCVRDEVMTSGSMAQIYGIQRMHILDGGRQREGGKE